MRSPKQHVAYVALLAAAFAGGVAVSWSALGARIDNDVYDLLFRISRPHPWRLQTALLEIDEDSLAEFHGIRRIRAPLAEGLEIVSKAAPRLVAIDIILAEETDKETDAKLAAALRSIPRLVLNCDLLPRAGTWEEPLALFRRHAEAVGHAYAAPDRFDSVSREIPLEKTSVSHDRRWALSLEALRVSRGADVLESPDDLQVGEIIIPASRAAGRLMRIRYVPTNMPPIPRVSLKDLLADRRLASRFTGRVVFAGVTAQTEGDRLFTPYGTMMSGLEIHASAFETMAQQLFLTDVPHWIVLSLSLALAAATGLAFFYLQGWQANAAAALILASAHAASFLFFTGRRVFPFATPVFSVWLSTVCAAAYQHFIVRRRLRKAEAERARYQQAMHFVTHEMKTPLTAIQGSSELMSRYALADDKRKQIAQLINSESKRLGRMIETFLNVERLSAGELELKRESFEVADLMDACANRVVPLAERKQIRVALEPPPSALRLSGDRELMEYALYNLLTNAVKYSPPGTQVTAFARRANGRICISVQDQGIGMDNKELKQIFRKFYRTRKALESGEAGTGIGLSIVEQIVSHHGGTVEVTSQPGHGSCFTLALPAAVPVAAERH